mmetsp:Transcript_29846/g.85431  ORF Transcript_29846/g.85431 Transcript_29846/m.85431 type:complete len:230 (-) Transcript_29846:344-1033(-)
MRPHNRQATAITCFMSVAVSKPSGTVATRVGEAFLAFAAAFAKSSPQSADVHQTHKTILPATIRTVSQERCVTVKIALVVGDATATTATCHCNQSISSIKRPRQVGLYRLIIMGPHGCQERASATTFPIEGWLLPYQHHQQLAHMHVKLHTDASTPPVLHVLLEPTPKAFVIVRWHELAELPATSDTASLRPLQHRSQSHRARRWAQQLQASFHDIQVPIRMRLCPRRD